MSESRGSSGGGDKGRIGWLDIAKGLAIALTLVGHTLVYGSMSRNIIFSFHMPLFFLLSGYTSRQISMDRMGRAVRKDAERLLLPIVLLLCADVLIRTVFYGAAPAEEVKNALVRLAWGNGNRYDFSVFSLQAVFPGIGVIWFLLSLFWSKQVYRIFLDKVRDHRLFLLLLAALAGMLVGRRLRLPLPQGLTWSATGGSI